LRAHWDGLSLNFYRLHIVGGDNGVGFLNSSFFFLLMTERHKRLTKMSVMRVVQVFKPSEDDYTGEEFFPSFLYTLGIAQSFFTHFI